jgi:hypothetical protein
MEIRYRSVEALRRCGRYHQEYHCRQVLYNLFYLRRNRIAKDHNLGKKFREFAAALRVNASVVRHAKQEMRKANRCILRKLFRRLRLLARTNLAKQRKMGWASRKWHPFATAITVAGTGAAVSTVGGERSTAALARDALVHSWSRLAACRRTLRALGQHIKARHRAKKTAKYYAFAHVRRHVYRCFRKLLSNSRRRNLKRRNSQALYVQFLGLQLRRAVSRLDINVSAKWANAQQQRLLQTDADTRHVCRAFAALRAGPLSLRAKAAAAAASAEEEAKANAAAQKAEGVRPQGEPEEKQSESDSSDASGGADTGIYSCSFDSADSSNREGEGEGGDEYFLSTSSFLDASATSGVGAGDDYNDEEEKEEVVVTEESCELLVVSG